MHDITFKIQLADQQKMKAKVKTPSPHATQLLISSLHYHHTLLSRCKVAPESWRIGGSKVVSSKGLEGYEMFDPKDSRREDRKEENA